MGKSKVIGFNANLMAKSMMENVVDEQNRRLIDYAKRTIVNIADAIQFYGGKHHMDDTGNLLDSLCWGLSYRGKLVDSGFYREQKATKLSYLHEWFGDNTEPVGGHVLAEKFIKQMANLTYSGWRLFFAILAPYWGYWEEGFKLKGRRGTKFIKFSVMTKYYDFVSKDLNPAKVSFKTEAPPYTKSDLEKLKEKRDKRAAKKGGFSVYDKYPRGKGKGKYYY